MCDCWASIFGGHWATSTGTTPCVSWDSCGMHLCECAYIICQEILADTYWCQSFKDNTHLTKKMAAQIIRTFLRP